MSRLASLSWPTIKMGSYTLYRRRALIGSAIAYAYASNARPDDDPFLHIQDRAARLAHPPRTDDGSDRALCQRESVSIIARPIGSDRNRALSCRSAGLAKPHPTRSPLRRRGHAHSAHFPCTPSRCARFPISVLSSVQPSASPLVHPRIYPLPPSTSIAPSTKLPLVSLPMCSHIIALIPIHTLEAP